MLRRPVCVFLFVIYFYCCPVLDCEKIPVYVLSLLSGDSWVSPFVMIGSLDIAACVFSAHERDFRGGNSLGWNCGFVRVYRCLPFVNLKNEIASYFTSKMSLFGISRELQFGTSKLWQIICKSEETKGR